MSNKGHAQHIIRGGVYYVNLDTMHTYTNAKGERRATHFLLNERPYIVISNNICNRVSPIVQVIPCISQREGGQSSKFNVEFKLGDDIGYVQCDQITSIDSDRLSASQFCGMLPPNIMSHIDTVVKLQLDMEYRGTDIQTVLLNLENALDKIEEYKRQEVAEQAALDKELQDTMNRINNKIAGNKYSGLSQIDKFNKKYNLNTTVKPKKESVTSGIGHKPETNDEKVDFVREYQAFKSNNDRAGMLSMVSKWDYRDLIAMQKAVSGIRKSLGKKGVNV